MYTTYMVKLNCTSQELTQFVSTQYGCVKDFLALVFKPNESPPLGDFVIHVEDICRFSRDSRLGLSLTCMCCKLLVHENTYLGFASNIMTLALSIHRLSQVMLQHPS